MIFSTVDPSTSGPDPSDTFRELRRRMVAEQLAASGIRDPRVLAAMSEVPREEFVPDELRGNAYDDGPLPIGRGQTISQPFTVAIMSELAQLDGQECVLEIGTGSGYGAAVLGRLAKEVHTVERIGWLADRARGKLRELGYDNVQVHTSDGTLGWPAGAPYSAIVVTAAAPQLVAALVAQLADGGRLVIPIDDGSSGQTMYRYTNQHGHLRRESFGRFMFVPLVTSRRQVDP